MRDLCCAAAAALMVIACGPSAKHDDTGDDGTGDDSGDDGPGPIDASTEPTPDAPACAAASAMAMETVLPVDIIWVIDNSGSMDTEETRVQNNMNAFAQAIDGSGTDYHVIVITDTSHIQVPPPLNPGPHFLGVNLNIQSHDALEKLVMSYPMYQSFLRPNSIKHIVVVTDDESDLSQSGFEAQLAALTAPGFGTGWRFHAVVAEDPPWDFTSHCFTLAADVGQTYIDLQVDHMGVFFSLCDTDWSPLFVTLAEAVTDDIALPCTFDIPPPPDGMTLDPTRVNFVYTPTGGTPITIPNVGTMAGCGSNNGWYYDNPAMPTQIIVCPATCTTLEGDPTGMVTVEFGCGTIIE